MSGRRVSRHTTRALVRVRPLVDPGLQRVRTGAGFDYRDGRGRRVAARDLARIEALVIPPAWRDVWISPDARGHIQAVGTDDAGRRQYLYHAAWTIDRDRGKFDRALQLAAALPRARARVTTSIRRSTLDRERLLATAFRLLDEAAPRVGSTRYMKNNGSRGLTTLLRRDAAVSGATLTLSFPAKSGRRALIDVHDEDLATVISELVVGRPRSVLLAYAHGRRRVPLTPRDVNLHVRALTGGSFTAKDFRTLRGTILAADALARLGWVDSRSERKRIEQRAVRAAAEGLGNTPAVARSSYIDPRVFRAYAQGRLLDVSVAGETAIRELLVGA